MLILDSRLAKLDWIVAKFSWNKVCICLKKVLKNFNVQLNHNCKITTYNYVIVQMRPAWETQFQTEILCREKNSKTWGLQPLKPILKITASSCIIWNPSYKISWICPWNEETQDSPLRVGFVAPWPEQKAAPGCPPWRPLNWQTGTLSREDPLEHANEISKGKKKRMNCVTKINCTLI